MPDPDDLERRVTALERDVASAHEDASQARADATAGLTLARACDRDQGTFTAKLDAHTKTLNALRDTQLEHSLEIADLKKQLTRLTDDVRSGFANNGARFVRLEHRIQTNHNAADTRFYSLEREMREGFSRLTKLLTRNPDEQG